MRAPVVSGIAKRDFRHSTQEVCPWNVRFSRELAEDSPFKPREVLRGKDARALARDLMAMSQDEFTAAFRMSPMKRAKLRGLKRNSVVVLSNGGSAEDVRVLAAALSDAEPIVRSHVAWALGQIGSEAAVSPLRTQIAVETDDRVLLELRRALVVCTPPVSSST